MAAEMRKSRSIKIKPIILRKAHVRAIESQKRLGQWLEEAILEKLAREEKETAEIERPAATGLSGVETNSGIV